ncbi:MAG: response regulator transcription factor [Gemmatimonadota bacterium]|nr:response regulator transcription factor [Gemmatimonadota bacterium]MDH3368611.1 response regulator transcription factor [Gemmatimonadota bacterium]MDH3477471.1 response regulator transcription factor [Gemmatimonadota bacterium]MDH3570007.1 response regulator transcription factor [Gemmatimonadota bacterium]MDH5548689.1 response regulator transcription factor [Gemmatimonadota bacterium]
MSEPIRVLLADDHAVLRSGLRRLLSAQPDLEVVGEASSGEEAIERTRTLRPDVVVMDIVMPGIGGVEATRRVAALGLGTRILALTGHDEQEFLIPVLKAGAGGYITKDKDAHELADAIRGIARNDVFLSPSATKLLLEVYRESSGSDPSAMHLLSARETEVLKLTAAGHSSSEIGPKLGVSAKTVDTYRGRVMQKLRLHRRSELVTFALQHGLLEPDR